MFKIIKRLAKCIGKYKINAILSPLFVMFEVILECAIPAIAGTLINELNNNASVDFGRIAMFCSILIGCAVLSLTFGARAGIQCSKASCGFAKNLRTELYNRSQDFSFENIDKFSSSSLVTRLTTDVTNVQQSFMMIIRTAVRSPFMFIFSIIMAFSVGGAMAFIFVVVVPILLFTLIFVAKKAMPIFKKVFKKYDTLNASVQENVAGMRVVKSFVRENHESDKFEYASDDVRKDFTRAEKILAFNNPVMQLCMYAIMICVLLFGSYVIIQTTGTAFNVGNFSMLLTYGIQMLMSLMMISMIFVMITMSLESGRRICEVLDEETTIKNPENPVMTVENGDITFKNVCFKYNERAEKNALSHIDLEIKSVQVAQNQPLFP